MKSGWLILAIVALFSCTDDHAVQQIPNGITLGSTYFPNEIGDTWIYDVFDSTRQSQYYVTVNISGNSIVNGKPAKIWTFKYPYEIDTCYVVTFDSTVIVYNRDKYSVADNYKVPIKTNNIWLGSWIYDNYKVTNSDYVNLPDKRKLIGYRILERGTSPNYLRLKDEWFVPYLGKVNFFRYEYHNGPANNKIWRLVACKLY